MALQLILDEQFGKDQIEVMNLARTNLGYELKGLALAALQLEPDIAIIFAGNNWGFSQPAFTDISDIDRAINTEGMAGVKRVCDEYIERTVRTMATEIAAEYKNNSVPLIWMVPEFNLGDWRQPFTNAPYLPENRNLEWIESNERSAARFARAGRCCPGGATGRENSRIGPGDVFGGLLRFGSVPSPRERLLRRKEVCGAGPRRAKLDSGSIWFPKPYAIAQQALREELPKHDCQVVDLPSVFKQYLNGEIPGVRLFVDYCHLTSEGMRVAMGAAASCVLRTLKGVDAPLGTIVSEHVAPPATIEAEAFFLAAIHSAHLYQRYEMVYQYCARASPVFNAHRRHHAQLHRASALEQSAVAHE